MNKLVDNFFYFIWRLLSPMSFIKFILTNNILISRKKAHLGNILELESISHKIKQELYNSPLFLEKVKIAKTTTDITGFTFDCFDFLSKDLKNLIYSTAYYNKTINSKVSSFLGISACLNTISIYANVPRKLDKEIGSKMWHRDSLTYLAADFMFAITDIDDNNGPFYWVNPANFGDSHFFKSKSENNWEKAGRFSDNDLYNLGLQKTSINKFIGKSGDYILLNTGESFHKGGFCKSEVRILGRFVYSSFGYSMGNLNKYVNSKHGLIFLLKNKLYSIHEKIYRNILKKIKK